MQAVPRPSQPFPYSSPGLWCCQTTLLKHCQKSVSAEVQIEELPRGIVAGWVSRIVHHPTAGIFFLPAFLRVLLRGPPADAIKTCKSNPTGYELAELVRPLRLVIRHNPAQRALVVEMKHTVYILGKGLTVLLSYMAASAALPRCVKCLHTSVSTYPCKYSDMCIRMRVQSQVI